MSDSNPDPGLSAGLLPVRQLLPAVYQDALQPGVKQLGVALESVLSLVPTLMLPLRYVSEAAKLLMAKRLDEFRCRLSILDAEKTVPIASELGVPVFERLLHTQDAMLVGLYLELLAKAANIETANLAHPAFARVIENLSPDEARIIGYLSGVMDGDNLGDAHFPVVEVQRHDADGTYEIVMGPLCDWAVEIELSFEGNVPAYIQNLSRLGVVEFSYMREVAPPTKYERVARHFKAFTDQGMTLHRGSGRVTPFGELFIRACVPQQTK